MTAAFQDSGLIFQELTVVMQLLKPRRAVIKVPRLDSFKWNIFVQKLMLRTLENRKIEAEQSSH